MTTKQQTWKAMTSLPVAERGCWNCVYQVAALKFACKPCRENQTGHVIWAQQPGSSWAWDKETHESPSTAWEKSRNKA